MTRSQEVNVRLFGEQVDVLFAGKNENRDDCPEACLVTDRLLMEETE
jgi:hypothetical protein